jgi:membrane-associated phospholipid phosphatase
MVMEQHALLVDDENRDGKVAEYLAWRDRGMVRHGGCASLSCQRYAMVELDATLARQLNACVRRWTALRTLTRLAARHLAVVEVALMLALAASGRRRSALRMLAAVGMVYVACDFIGWLWPRARPFSADLGVEVLVEHHAERSFPSRHVASGLAMAIIGGADHRRLGRAMASVAAALGTTRVAAGLHYPSDVIGGAVLGAAIGYGLRT